MAKRIIDMSEAEQPRLTPTVPSESNMTYTWTIDLTIPTKRDRNDIIGLVVGSDADHCVDLNDKPVAMSEHDVLCMLAEALDLPKPY